MRSNKARREARQQSAIVRQEESDMLLAKGKHVAQQEGLNELLEQEQSKVKVVRRKAREELRVLARNKKNENT